MAVLPDTDRARTAAQWMRDNRAAVAFTKPDLRAAVNAIDDYLDGMQLTRPATSLRAAVLAASPNFVNTASAAVQLDVLGYVMMRRANHLTAQEDG